MSIQDWWRTTPEDMAPKFADNWNSRDWSAFDFTWHTAYELEREGLDPHQWGIYLGYSDNSEMIEVSNTEVMWEDLKRYGEKWVRYESHNMNGIWAYGFTIRVYRKDGKLSAAFMEFYDFMQSLANYGCLDEQDWSRREWEYAAEQLGEMFRQESPISDFEIEGDKDEFFDGILHDISDTALESLQRRDGGWPTKDVVDVLNKRGWFYNEEEMEWEYDITTQGTKVMYGVTDDQLVLPLE